jgi:hypothetical protein
MRIRSRVLTVAAIAGFAVLGLAGPAFAHVEVSADKKTAGAENVTLTFHGEAERDDAGIRSERVVLPQGIEPSSVTLVKAPAGWAFTRGADGFTVGGKALGIGADAVWKVRIAKLPDGRTRLSFKTLETYANGEVDRWIEIQEPGQDEPDHPAPLLILQPGRSAAAATQPPAPSAEPSAAAPVTTATLLPLAQNDDSGTVWWIWSIAAVAVVAVLAAILLRRRRVTRVTPPPDK